MAEPQISLTNLRIQANLTRKELANSLEALEISLNIPARFRRSIGQSPGRTLAIAAAGGFAASRLIPFLVRIGGKSWGGAFAAKMLSRAAPSIASALASGVAAKFLGKSRE